MIDAPQSTAVCLILKMARILPKYLLCRSLLDCNIVTRNISRKDGNQRQITAFPSKSPTESAIGKLASKPTKVNNLSNFLHIAKSQFYTGCPDVYLCSKISFQSQLFSSNVLCFSSWDSYIYDQISAEICPSETIIDSSMKPVIELSTDGVIALKSITAGSPTHCWSSRIICSKIALAV